MCDREWRDYDPNWRQFLGLVLWVTQRLHGHVLPDDLNDAMLRAAHDAARSEPPGRINERYTNVALMHAWLQHACGVAPDGLAAAVAAQVRDDGDIAEYNSPTYDAISLLAASLLVDYASDPALQELGRLVRQRVALDSLPCGTTRSACRPARIRGRTVSTRACTCRSCQCS